MNLPHLIHLASAILAVSAHGETVKIQLCRPEKPGQASGIVIDLTQISARTLSQQGEASQTQKESTNTRFEARREALCVNASGKATRVKYTVRTFRVRNERQQPGDILRPGQVIVAERIGNETRFTVDAAEVADPTSKNLYGLLNIAVDTGPNSDAIFQTNQPRLVGQQWHIELDRNARMKLGAQLDGSGSDGTGKIERLERINGIDCAVFTAMLDLNTGAGNLGAMGVNLSELPAGTTVKKATSRIVATGLLPLDPALPEMGERFKTEMVTKLNIPQPDGRPVTLDSVIEIVRAESLTFEPELVLIEPAPIPARATPPRNESMAGILRNMEQLPYTRRQAPARHPSPPSARGPNTDHIGGYLGSLGIDN